MCNHKSFESLTVKVLGNNWTLPLPSYCDGSRNHGCGGCFCRYPEFDDHSQPCLKCGKLFFALFDALWEVRRKVYKEYFLRSTTWAELFIMEYRVEEELWDQIYKRDVILPDKKIGRRGILDFFINLTSEITDAVIEERRKAMGEGEDALPLSTKEVLSGSQSS